LAIRLSLRKGEGRVRVTLCSRLARTPHRNPLPFCERGEAESNPADDSWRAILLVIALSFLVRILGADCEGDSTARRELRGDDRLARRAHFDEIVQDAVRD